MELVVINGASSIARGVIRNIVKKHNYQKVRFLDPKPFRQGVYQLQKDLTGVEFTKHQTGTAANLEIALEGAQNVLYFHHDYLAMTSDKNAVLASTARIAKKQGINGLIAVCPIEHDLYYTEDDKTPFQKKLEAQQDAISHFGSTVILNTNLVFGPLNRDSYLINYLAQCAAAGSAPGALVNASKYHFTPVHSEDVAYAVEQASKNFDKLKGSISNVNGSEDVTIKEILETLEVSVGKNKGNTKAQTSLGGLSDYVQEFFVGISHDRNLTRLAEHFESHPSINLKENDFFGKLNLQNKHSFRQNYKDGEIKVEELVSPIFTAYKGVSLD